MIGAENWCVKVEDRIYGPYTTEQLRKFAHEGRLAAWSLIAPAGNRQWRPARKESIFAMFFGGGGGEQASAQPTKPGFGRRRQEGDPQTDAPKTGDAARGNAQGAAKPRSAGSPSAARASARQTSSQQTNSHQTGSTKPLLPHPQIVDAKHSDAQPRRAQPIGQTHSARPTESRKGPANFIIIFDVVSGAASRVEAGVLTLGPCFRLAENVWSVNSALTATGVRNAVAPYLRPQESIFVVEAIDGRCSWQNYAPGPHARISDAYLHANKPARRAGAA